MRVPQGAPALSMCVLLVAATWELSPSVWLDTSTNLHARLVTAEGEVAPRDVLEHVREVEDHGGAGRAPFLAFARLLVRHVAAEAVEEHGPQRRAQCPL